MSPCSAPSGLGALARYAVDHPERDGQRLPLLELRALRSLLERLALAEEPHVSLYSLAG